MIPCLRLPLAFDVAGLLRDLASVPPEDWAPHYNAADYGGVWRGAALRSSTGSARQLAALAPSFQDTPLLGRCPHFRAALGAFRCPLKSARLLALAPGSFIREHTDNALDFEDGEVRIHIPIETNPGVEFYVDGERLLLEPGGAYYLNVNLPHRVNNRGAGERIHLVIDAQVDDWLRDLFGRSSPIPPAAPPARGVEAFRDAALSDPALREPLAAAADLDSFRAAAVRLASERGYDFDGYDVDALVRGRARPGPPGGLPIAVEIRQGEAFADWVDADPPLAEPFFDETVRAVLRRPYARFSRRRARLAPADSARAPAGLIFHMSRCGSTLAGRMLAAAGLRVISEAAAIDAVVQSGDAGWLRSIAGALGAGRPHVLKLDAWHIHAMPLLRAAFPDTPWIFLYRDPIEVLASHARSPGRHTMPGALDPRALGMAPDEFTRCPREAWPARVLARICEAALTHRADPAGLFLDYRELPDAMWERVAAHFAIRADADRMREAAREDAKVPGSPFFPDSAAKRAEGAAHEAFVHEAGLDKVYRELREGALD